MRWVWGSLVVLLVGVLTWTVPGQPGSAALHPLDGSMPLAAGPRPALPWKPGLPQLGVQVYWVDDPADSTEVVRRKAARVFDHVIGLEANAVSISFPYFTETITSAAVLTDQRTPSPERLAVVVDEARRSGLRVAVRPLLDEANLVQHDPRDWRGKLDPADRDAWFASYRQFLAPYLRMAQAHQVQTFVLGAELSMMQADPRWRDLVATARFTYTGELGYAANWDAYQQAVTSVPVDTVGIDAYPQLGLPRGADGEQMRAAWRSWLDRTLTGPGRDTPLYEVGAAAEARTLENPAIPHTPGTELDEGVQARWFAAACSAAHEHGVAGLYWWKIELHDDPAHADPVADLHDSFQGRRAEVAMRRCFAAWSSAP